MEVRHPPRITWWSGACRRATLQPVVEMEPAGTIREKLARFETFRSFSKVNR